MRRYRLLASALLQLSILLTAFNAVAETTGQPRLLLSLEEAQSLAFGQSPEAGEIEETYQGSLADARTVTTLANPEVSGDLTFPAATGKERGDPEYSLRLRHTLKPSLFALRRSLAQTITNTADSEKKAALLALAARVRIHYTEIWSAQERSRMIEELSARLRERVQAVSQAVEKGALAKGDQRLFEAERFRLEASLVDARAHEAAATAELTRLTGITHEGPIETLSPRQAVPELEALEAKASANEAGVIARIRARKALADEQIRYARRDRGISYTPELIYEHTDSGNDMVGIGLTVPLPVFDRNEGEILRRQGALSAADSLERYAASGALERELRQRFNAVQSMITQLTTYRERVIPALREALSEHERQYARGQLALTQIWQTTRALIEAHESSIELQNKLAVLIGDLSLLVGEPL